PRVITNRSKAAPAHATRSRACRPGDAPMNAPMPKERLWFLDTLVRVRVSEQGNSDGMSVIEHVMPKGFSPPLHIHHGEDALCHAADAEARFVIDGRDALVGRGDTLLAPRGLRHSFIVTSDRGARWLTITQGGDFERMVRASSRPAARDELPNS